MASSLSFHIKRLLRLPPALPEPASGRVMRHILVMRRSAAKLCPKPPGREWQDKKHYRPKKKSRSCLNQCQRNLHASESKSLSSNETEIGAQAFNEFYAEIVMNDLSPATFAGEENSPIVVVGGNVGALGIARSLAVAKTRVIIVYTTRLNAALWSRHCESVVIKDTSGESLIEGLERIGRSFARPALLILTEDRSVETVSKLRDRLTSYFRILLPSDDAVDVLADKAKFQDFAEREGLPVPLSLVLNSANDIGSLDTIDAPVIVKPARKTSLRSADLERVRRFESIVEAKSHCLALVSSNAGAIVQQWVEGPDDSIYFCLFYCDETGLPLQIFTGRKLSAYPPGVGSTVTCIAAPEAHAQLTEITTRLTSLIRFSGIGGLEFKRDERSGTFFIIEPTVGRTDWQEEIATLSGVNIPLAAYFHVTGRPISTVSFGCQAVVWRTSFKHRIPASLRDSGVPIIDGYWRVNDPIPGLIFYGVEPFRRIVNRIISRFNQFRSTYRLDWAKN